LREILQKLASFDCGASSFIHLGFIFTCFDSPVDA